MWTKKLTKPNTGHQGLEGWFLLLWWWLFLAACGILVPRPGIEPAHPALEVQSLKPLDH